MDFILFFLLISIFLFVQFNSISCIQEKKLSSVYADSESIKVQLPRYNEEILSCRLEVRFLSGKSPNSFKLYDKKLSLYRNDMFKYVGKDDNTCSFEILAYKLPEYFSYENGSPLTEEWVVYEQHVDDGSWYKKLKSKLGATESDKRKYIFYLSPQTSYDRVKMSLSGHQITRHAPYTNKSITIITQPRKNIVRKCRLYTSYFENSIEHILEVRLYDKNASISLSRESGTEFLGAHDNSCSFRIFIDKLEKQHKKYFDRIWEINEYYEDNEEKIPSIFVQYNFKMPSISWWKNNKKSRLYLAEGLYGKIEEEYF